MSRESLVINVKCLHNINAARVGCWIGKGGHDLQGPSFHAFVSMHSDGNFEEPFTTNLTMLWVIKLTHQPSKFSGVQMAFGDNFGLLLPVMPTVPTAFSHVGHLIGLSKEDDCLGCCPEGGKCTRQALSVSVAPEGSLSMLACTGQQAGGGAGSTYQCHLPWS